MAFSCMLRDRVDLFRALPGLDDDGDETVSHRPLAKGVAGFFDQWEARVDTVAERLDARRHARLFLPTSAPELAPGDRVDFEGGAWLVERQSTVRGRVAAVRALELVWLPDPPEPLPAETEEEEKETPA